MTIAFTANAGTLTLKNGSTVAVKAGTPKPVITAVGGDLVIDGHDANGPAAFTFAANGDLEVEDADIEFTGKVNFGRDLTLTDKGVIFKGIATFEPNAVITLADTTSVITLNAGAGLAVGKDGRYPYNGILSNSDVTNPVTLTPSAALTLIIGGDRSITQDGTGNHGITVGGGAKLGLPAGAGYVVKSAGSKVGTLTLSTDLILGAGALAETEAENQGPFGDTLKEHGLVADYFDAEGGEGIIESGLTGDINITSLLILEGATGNDGALLKGTGKVKAGYAEIVGGSNGWQAVDAGTAAVAIGHNVIFGSAALTGKDSNSAIGVTATTEITPQLVVAAKIDLSANGTITLTGDNSANKASMLLNGGVFLPGSLKATANSSDVNIGGNTTNANFKLVGTSNKTGLITHQDGSTTFVTNDNTSTGGDKIVAKAAQTDASTSNGVALGTLGGGTGDSGLSVLVTISSFSTSDALIITSGVKIECPNM
jgi:hypothetical protein